MLYLKSNKEKKGITTMNTKENIKNILATKEQLDNDTIIGMIAVRDILEYISNIVTDDEKLNNILNKIYSTFEDTDSCALWEDLEYLENDFKALKKFAN